MYRNSFPCTTLRMSNLQLCVYIIIVGNVDGGGCGAFSIDSCPTVRPAFSFFSFPFAIFPVCFSIFHITFELRFVLLVCTLCGVLQHDNYNYNNNSNSNLQFISKESSSYIYNIYRFLYTILLLFT